MHSGVELIGRYRLEKLLGQGAMGEVWSALDQRLDRRVAIKLIRDDQAHLDDRLERFHTESRLAARLQHPGITVVHDYGSHEGRWYIVMEYLDGRDLQSLLSAERNGLPIDRVLDIGIAVADALTAAHAELVVHRDVKPANIMVTNGGRVKLCDFGIARDADSESAVWTGVGTPAYRAPEQYAGVPGSRADVYSLGCVLYALATGAPPFVGRVQGLWLDHLRREPERPSTVRPGVPRRVDDVIMRLLEKRPEDRMDADELGSLLTEIARDPLTAVIGAVPPAAPTRLLSETDGDNRPSLPTREDCRGKFRPSVSGAPLAWLSSGSPHRSHTRANTEIMDRAQRVLDDNRARAKVRRCTRGPTIGLYEISPDPGVPVSKVTDLAEEFVAAFPRLSVTLLPSIPSSSPLGTGTSVGLEVSNPDRDTVALGDVLRELPDQDRGSALSVGLGRDADGAVGLDLAAAPHLLIAGGDDAGRSGLLHTVIGSMLAHSASLPHLLPVGGERGALAAYGALPRLVAPLVSTHERRIAALDWLKDEMERRYDDLSAHDMREIGAFNSAVTSGRLPTPLRSLDRRTHPPIVVVIEESADLMDTAPDAAEERIARLGGLSRPVGIHMVLATRHIERAILTDRIRSVFPSRIALRTKTRRESELIVDQGGAERLLDSGDALYLRKGARSARRVQCSSLSPEEVGRLIAHRTERAT